MGIIKKEQRKRMLDVTLSYLETAGYKINSADENKIIILPKIESDNRRLHLFLHNQKTNYKTFKHEVNDILHQDDFISNIFFKDGENFHVRLGARANIKGNERSLKRYTDGDLNKMLHLRNLEKLALGRNSPQTALTYYQPETQRLTEGFRSYNMGNVMLNYEHISPQDRRFDFVREKVADDYKIAQEITEERKNMRFSPRKKGSKILIVNAPKYAGRK